MFRIERLSEDGGDRLRLSGRLEAEHLPELDAEIRRSGPRTVVDLEEVSLLDRPALRFLIQREAEGVVLVNVPLFVREWMRIEELRGRH